MLLLLHAIILCLHTRIVIRPCGRASSGHYTKVVSHF